MNLVKTPSLNQVRPKPLVPTQSVPRRSLEQRGDVVVAERFGVRPVEDLEVLAIEADESFLGAEPEIPIARLQDGLDGILRQPVIGLPRVVDVLGQGFVGIERERRRRPGDQQDNGARAHGDDSPSTHNRSFAEQRTVSGSTTRAGGRAPGAGRSAKKPPKGRDWRTFSRGKAVALGCTCANSLSDSSALTFDESALHALDVARRLQPSAKCVAERGLSVLAHQVVYRIDESRAAPLTTALLVETVFEWESVEELVTPRVRGTRPHRPVRI